MIYKMVTFRVKSEKIQDVLTAVEALENGICSHEPDTLRYESFQKRDDPGAFVHIMIFRNPAAEEQHRNSAHVKAFTKLLYPVCEILPEFSELLRIGDSPLS